MRKLCSLFSLLILGSALVCLPGCSVFHGIKSMFSKDEEVQIDPEVRAQEGMAKFNNGQYSDALKIFGELKDRFPFSRYSLMAELKSADCQFYLGHYSEAISGYEDFAKNHPTNEAIPYVLFQIAMSHYNQMDTIDRDPGSAIDAESAFQKLLHLYPASPYSEEAKLKIKACRDFLASHEMYVATFYLKTDKLEQSKARLQYLLDNYPESAVAPEAKKMLAQLESGKPPKGRWRDWIPEVGLPDWSIFGDFGKVSTPKEERPGGGGN